MKKSSGIVKKLDDPDLYEPVFDKASDQVAKSVFGAVLPDLVKELPILKYAKSAIDVYGAYRVDKLYRRMKAFLVALETESKGLADFKLLPEGERQMIVDILVAELDVYAEDRQAEALSLLFKSYITKRIPRELFVGVSHELKQVNPLTFYFGMDGFVTEKTSRATRIQGPLQYLPSAFFANQTSGLAFSSDTWLTNLGDVFFQEVYQPMNEKYSI